MKNLIFLVSFLFFFIPQLYYILQVNINSGTYNIICCNKISSIPESLTATTYFCSVAECTPSTSFLNSYEILLKTNANRVKFFNK